MPARHHGHANCSRLSVTFILNFHRRGYYPISLFIRNICLHFAYYHRHHLGPQYQFNTVCGIACILNAANRRGNQFVILHIIAVGSWLPFYKLIQRRKLLHFFEQIQGLARVESENYSPDPTASCYSFFYYYPCFCCNEMHIKEICSITTVLGLRR